MKPYLIVILLLCTVIPVFGQDKLQQYLDEGNYFKLKQYLPYSQLTPEKRLYFEAYVANAFNQNSISILKIDSLLYTDSIRNNNERAAQLWELQMDNYSKLYNYKKAADCGDTILNRYSTYVDNKEDVENMYKIWAGLANTPAQLLEKKGNVTIRMQKDKSKLWNVPVHAADTTIDFIFDTGANISTIVESMAEKLHLKRLHLSIEVAGIQGTKVPCDIGVADSIEIGDIKIRNVVFLVLPDASLSFKKAGYYIHGIIGYPVIAAMKEIHLSQIGSLTIPMAPHTGKVQNLALDGMFPMVNVATDDDTLLFHFDTGAMTSYLYSIYFEKYKAAIKKEGRVQHSKVGGAGGVKKLTSYKISDFNLYIGDKKATLPSIDVLTKQIKSTKEQVYGNLGQDLIRQFDEMVINFESMYVEFN